MVGCGLPVDLSRGRQWIVAALSRLRLDGKAGRRSTYGGVAGVKEDACETLDLFVVKVGFNVLLEGGGGFFGWCGSHGAGLLLLCA